MNKTNKVIISVVIVFLSYLKVDASGLYFNYNWYVDNDKYANDYIGIPGARLVDKCIAGDATRMIDATYVPPKFNKDLSNMPTIFLVDILNNNIIWQVIEKSNTILGDNYSIQPGEYRPRGGNTSLSRPTDIEVRSNGDVFVCDTINCRIVKLHFNSDGTMNYDMAFGSQGNQFGQFFFPRAISSDRNGNMYVADTGNNRVQKFNSNGNYILSFGKYGGKNGEFINPIGIAADSPYGRLYVSDNGNNRIQVFDLNGNFIKSFYKSEYMPANPKYGSLDTCIDGNLYVVDSENKLLYKFNYDMEFIESYDRGANNNRFTSLNDIAVEKAFNANGEWYMPNGFIGVLEDTKVHGAMLWMDVIRVSASRSSFTPANGETTKISFTPTQNGNCTIKIYNSNGGLVKTLMNDETVIPGKKELIWDGKNDLGIIMYGQFTVEITADFWGRLATPREIPIEVIYSEPLSPPTLTIPTDGETIVNNITPSFTWQDYTNDLRFSHYEIQIDNNSDFLSPESVMFSDDFSDGAAVYWRPVMGKWGITNVDGNYRYGQYQKDSSENHAITLIAGDYNWQDYQVDVDVYVKEGDQVNIITRWTDNDNWYIIGLGGCVEVQSLLETGLV